MIGNLCWSFIGNRREYTMSVSEYVDGIYTTFDKYEEYTKDQLVGNITAGENSTGNFLCIKIANKRVMCEELYCNATIPFIGSVPEEYSLSILINRLTGKGNVADYYLDFERMVNGINITFKTT